MDNRRYNGDRVCKIPIHIILIVDTSRSMNGERISQVNDAVNDILKDLKVLQSDNFRYSFGLTIIPFSTESYILNESKGVDVSEFNYTPLKCGGQSNIDTAYVLLEKILNKKSKGGIMPEFGGVAPIIMALTDGHSSRKYDKELAKLKERPWFKVALRYGIAIGLYDEKTIKVLKDFVDENGDVIRCEKNNRLSKYVKTIAITASKVKSATSNSQTQNPSEGKEIDNCVQAINEAIDDELDW